MEIYHKKCEEVLPTIKDKSIRLILTDPPYNAVNRPIGKMKSCRSMDKGEADSAEIDITFLAKEFVRICSGSIYVWCSTEQSGIWRKEFANNNLTTRQCVWIRSNTSPLNGDKMWLSGMELCIFARKPKAVFNRFCQVPAWYGPAQRIKGFPCPKPLWLMKEIIDASSEIGDIVLDPFLGSGQTGIAALEMGRDFIGCEKNSDYFNLAQNRISNSKEEFQKYCKKTNLKSLCQ